MGYASANAGGPRYRGAQAPRKFALVLGAVATAFASAFCIVQFGRFTSLADAAIPKDASSFFNDRFSRASTPSSVGLPQWTLIRSLPADIEPNLQEAKTLLA